MTHLDNSERAKARRRAMFAASSTESNAAETITLTGRVKRETEKAVLFHSRVGGERWFPKSQINVCYRSMGNLDQLIVSGWLVSKEPAIFEMAN